MILHVVVVDSVLGTVVWPNEADFAPEALYDLPAEEEPVAPDRPQPQTATTLQGAGEPQSLWRSLLFTSSALSVSSVDE